MAKRLLGGWGRAIAVLILLACCVLFIIFEELWIVGIAMIIIFGLFLKRPSE